MAVNRFVSREREAVEFRPIPGQEADWAGSGYCPRSRLWDWLGLYPVGLYLCLCMLLLGGA